MKVRYTYRLRPGQSAQRYLAREWGMCRFVWNEMVAHSQALFDARQSIALAGAEPVGFGPAAADKLLTQMRARLRDEDGVAWLAQGSSVAQQQTVRDFCTSRSRAIADITSAKPAHQRAGMPRFRRREASLPTLNYTTRGFSLRVDPVTGREVLVLPGRISIPVVWSRPLPSVPSSVRVSQDSLGHWYASFVVDIEYAHQSPAQDRVALGIDWGVTETATTARVNTSDGSVDESTTYDLPHTGHGARTAQELAQAQRTMARRARPKGQAQSHGYRLAKFKAARLQKKIARQRKDDARKWAKKVATDHHKIAVEDFQPKFLSRSTSARKAADAAIAATKAELIWQAKKLGRDLRLVHPGYTTMDCYACGARATHRLPLSERTYTCTHCGSVRPRDKNSAAIMVARAGFVPADAEGRRPGPATALAQAA